MFFTLLDHKLSSVTDRVSNIVSYNVLSLEIKVASLPVEPDPCDICRSCYRHH